MIRFLISLTLGLALSAHADPVKLIVPLATGATMDDVARTVAVELSKKINKNIVVENRPGASGAVGMEYAANSNPDGQTLVIVNNGTLNMLPELNSKVGYNGSSFVSIGLIGVSPLVLVTGNNTPYNNLKQLSDHIKNNPGQASWASPGIGTNLHLLGEILKAQHDLDLVHILYKGMSQAYIDVSENRVTMFFDVPNAKMFNFFEVNKLKALAVTSDQRIANLSNIPTVKEQGFPLLTSHVWFALAVPAKTPEHIINQLRTALSNSIEEPELKDKLKKLGLDVSGIKASDSQKYIDNERLRWTKVIKQANIKVE